MKEASHGSGERSGGEPIERQPFAPLRNIVNAEKGLTSFWLKEKCMRPAPRVDLVRRLVESIAVEVLGCRVFSKTCTRINRRAFLISPTDRRSMPPAFVSLSALS